MELEKDQMGSTGENSISVILKEMEDYARGFKRMATIMQLPRNKWLLQLSLGMREEVLSGKKCEF